ncbi:MarR family transcriptional regulator [Clostridium manihotivorum]|uniref:MarR family transcriptional regulator n=1 Tax=Clostridium manihotivorum TaxID=2320868 RepID=A0A3R5X2V8_9CLOT|nr:MarR family transcriptional regulator [Clostridium manihotivorum]QAA33113.1 MarR family transcriptional regulator [Clostridium manihotivorum]
MNEYLKELNLIDLVSEKHKRLRSEVMKRWIDKDGEEITDTESHFLAMLNKNSMTIAQAARKIRVSRQAAHKCAMKLIDEEYVKVIPIEGNKKEKLVLLTAKGQSYCDEMLKIKKKIEDEISLRIGKDKTEELKVLLRTDWIDE